MSFKRHVTISVVSPTWAKCTLESIKYMFPRERKEVVGQGEVDGGIFLVVVRFPSVPPLFPPPSFLFSFLH